MSGVQWRATTGEVTTGVAALTALQLVAASNHRVYIDKIDVSFKGIVVTDAPIKVRILRQTTAGTMSALTPTKGNDADDETLQITAQHTATAEPTAGDLLDSGEVHPQTARRFGPFWMKGAGKIGVEVTAGASTSVIVSAAGEE